jgi:hypothetical protein
MLATVGVKSWWTYYLQTADQATIAATYPHVQSYLSTWTRDANGLLVPRPGKPTVWNWQDWGDGIDGPPLDNAWYYMALDGAARMADLLGNTADASSYRGIMSELKAAFLKAFWDGSRVASPGRSAPPDDRCNGLAIVAGLLGAAEWPAVKAVLSNTTNSSPYMEKYVLESYFLMGDAQAGLTRMRSRYQGMIQSTYTTLWEYWDTSGTISHGWSGGPLTLLSKYVAGVSPVKPGYETFSVLPQLGDLTSAKATVASPRGTITVKVTRTAIQYAITVTVPAGTTATVGLPTAAFSGGTAAQMNISANGMQVFSKGSVTGAVPGVTYAATTGGYVTFTVSPGTWNFSAAPAQ